MAEWASEAAPLPLAEQSSEDHLRSLPDEWHSAPVPAGWSVRERLELRLPSEVELSVPEPVAVAPRPQVSGSVGPLELAVRSERVASPEEPLAQSPTERLEVHRMPSR